MDRTQDTPAVAAGGAFRMMLYLVPVLLLVLVAIRGLKSAQSRLGGASGVKSALGGGIALAGSRRSGSIRVLETTRLGTSSLHLVDVRGRTLLLCATGAAVSVLADVTSSGSDGANEFGQAMREASAEIGGLIGEDGSLSGIVGSLDGKLREVSECVARSSSRARAWGQAGTDHGTR